MARMAELIVVSGPPGAGKSTVARLLADSFERSALVPGDDFFALVRRGFVDPWRDEAHRQNEAVTRAAAAATGQLVDGGYPVVYDGVLGPWFAQLFLAATGLEALHYAVLLPPLRCCRARVAGRTGHGFTDLSAAEQLHRQFSAAGVPARHLVTGEEPPEAIAEQIRQRLAAGELHYRG